MDYFTSLTDQLTKRAARATLGQFGVRAKPLRAFLNQQFNRAPGQSGAFLAEPVIEATFGWLPHQHTMAQLSGNLLQPKVVEAMSNPPKAFEQEYRFDSVFYPYAHQFETWQHFTEQQARSVIVSSGTGSGKTECFLVPILNDIVSRGSKNDGVEAIMLYPLNALINSQKDRLAAWTHGLGPKVQFCLYNGDTPERSSIKQRQLAPNQTLSRTELRLNPAQILVTNATMLEYMLVRKQDKEILKKSQGKLRWIVLDEAHTYVGSQAAELALLLRRVMHGFGVEAKDVRFVATSATIGGDDADMALREFLSNLAGVSIDHVYLVKGSRLVKDVPPVSNLQSMNLEAISAMDPAQRFDAICNLQPLQTLRHYFSAEDNRQTLSKIGKILTGTDKSLPTEQTLRWLDICATSKNAAGEAFIPMRLHLFHRVSGGLWACSNKDCHCKENTPLDSIDWPFGMVSMHRKQKCDCGALMFELIHCSDCGTSMLLADTETSEEGITRLVMTKPPSNIDDFELVLPDDEEDEPADELKDEQQEPNGDTFIQGKQTLLSAVPGEETAQYWISQSGLLSQSAAKNSYSVHKVEGYFRSDGQQAVRCPCCRKTNRKEANFYRHYRNGAPFMLSTVVPTLLEHCKEGEKSKYTKPWHGRRMITFTDSRQGTAQFAARSQQNSERQFLRNELYHLVARRTIEKSHLSQDDKLELEQLLESREKLIAADLGEHTGPTDEKIERLTPQHVSISWSVAEDIISQNRDLTSWIKSTYKHFGDEVTFGRNEAMLARLLLLREFANRPKFGNTLETMGFIKLVYPDLAEQGRRAPQSWRNFFKSDAEAEQQWHNFLTICANHHVRTYKAIKIDYEEIRWIGAKFTRTYLIGPNDPRPTSATVKRWPQVKSGSQRSKLVRLLATSFKLDIDRKDHRDTVDAMLLAAWEALRMNLLNLGAEGHYLDLTTKVHFALVKEKWQCPHTLQIVDSHLLEVTPYLTEWSERDQQLCQKLDIPEYPYPYDEDFESGEQKSLEQIRDWQEQEKIQVARAANGWSDIADRTVERSPYYRVAEHSAQISAKLLKYYEKAFKDEEINVLSCSTTMEMGVDIGGITVVAMNNAPPNPANYLQRAGRAGRRSESQAVALTLCKNTPHGEHIFNNTRWPFDTDIPVPKVAISSEFIVRRHINALMLSVFLKRVNNDDEPLQLSCGKFFLPLHENSVSMAERFITWCHKDSGTIIEQGLKTLLARTALEQHSLDDVIATCIEHMDEIKSKWCGEYELMDKQGEQMLKDETRLSTAAKALELQLMRLEGEYLLSELSRKGFLPGYGFPTDVVSLNNDNMEVLEQRNKAIEAHKQRRKNKKKQGDYELQHREDNLFSARDYPSRDLSVALRDYSPGGEVVVDGRVYQSGGVLLNWHTPADVDQVTEIQSLRFAWRCKQCGASGTKHEPIALCPNCGCDNKELLVGHRYLQPSSFAIDVRDKPHNDISKPAYLSFQDPWVTVEDENWQALSVNPCAMVRSSHDGHVYYYHGGVNNAGYALCLECGKMAPMTGVEGENALNVLADHLRLRGGRGDQERADDKLCGGNDRAFAIQGPLHLGHSTRTDVFELVLFDRNGAVLNDKMIARSIAVALRNVLANYLGINNDEIGCSTKPVNYQGQKAKAVVLYDNAAGGAGFVIQAGEHAAMLLEKAKEAMAGCDCDNACHKCLVDFSTQHVFEELNRKAALDYLDDDFFNRLRLPSSHQVFGSITQLEVKPIELAVATAIQSRTSIPLRLYLQTHYLSDLTTWPFIYLLYQWAASHPVELVIATTDVGNLSIDQQVTLTCFANHPNIALTKAVHSSPNIRYFAEVDTAKGHFGWALVDDGFFVTATTDRAEVAPIELELLQSVETQTCVMVRSEFDGPTREFGQKFWAGLRQDCQWLDDKLKQQSLIRIDYTDRYLLAPLPLSLCLEVIGQLLIEHPSCRAGVVTKRLSYNEKLAKKSKKVIHNFADSETCQKVAHAIAAENQWDIHLTDQQSNLMPHARKLSLSFDDGKTIDIYLDQGFGFWDIDRTDEQSRFPFDEPDERQIEAMAQGNWPIFGGSWPTAVFVLG